QCVYKGVVPCTGVGGVSVVDFFFFFQAEDGIRDLIVTGVQTCALPISERPRRRRWLIHCISTPCASARRGTWPRRGSHPPRDRRSEERRVGKECRSRWWPDD